VCERRSVTGQHPNAALIQRLYQALDAGDGETMAALYAPGAHFRDPAFGDLHGEEPGDMWRMLCSQAKDLAVTASDVRADDREGSASWRATYTFTATGRPVVNEVIASFRFEDGLIADHRDDFSMWRWSRQALGPAALLLGSNPLGQSLIRRNARGRLASWRDGRG
jgi:ketosteroid isomerase-like protein